jgi:rSAM/selenodomain-associated transferase 2
LIEARFAMRVSVVIPTYQEATTILACLSRLAAQGADEVVVADGCSSDGTAELAKRHGARVITAPLGRGTQQNLGAAATSGDVLLFLHADCRLETGAIEVLRRFMCGHPRIPGGCFRMRVDAADPRFRLIDLAADIRGGLLGIPYGDQGLFASRWAFERVGGFPETRLMEDVLLSLKLRQLGRVVRLPARIFVSPRRWQRTGIVRQSVWNWTLTLLAALQVPPDRLARHYPVVR